MLSLRLILSGAETADNCVHAVQPLVPDTSVESIALDELQEN